MAMRFPTKTFSDCVLFTKSFCQHATDSGLQGITEVEIVTALAYDYFAQQQVDVAIIEVGMGGLLDSTNVVSPY